MKRIVFVVFIAALCSYGNLIAQEKPTTADPVLNESIQVTHVEAIEYPVLAWIARTQGIVVTRVKLDTAGRVVSTTAVSGYKMLIPDCLSNAMKWRFQPNSNKEAVIIYDFRLEGDCMLPSCRQSFFLFAAQTSQSLRPLHLWFNSR